MQIMQQPARLLAAAGHSAAAAAAPHMLAGEPPWVQAVWAPAKRQQAGFTGVCRMTAPLRRSRDQPPAPVATVRQPRSRTSRLRAARVDGTRLARLHVLTHLAAMFMHRCCQGGVTHARAASRVPV